MNSGGHRRIRPFLIGLLAGLVLASAGVAGARQGELGPQAKVRLSQPPEQKHEGKGAGTDGDRQAECEEAAGLSDEGSGDGGGEGGGSEEVSTGLDHAIQVVLANCLKNPQAPGLVNALRHLAENRERKMAHDEARAERKAARAASGKGHGKSTNRTP